MAMTPDAIKLQMTKALNEKLDPDTAATNIANAIIATIASATVTYTPATLVAPSGGGPVTDISAPIATLS